MRLTSDGATRDLFPIAVHPAEGAALSRWVRSERASATIEVGFGYGVSALFILQGLLAGGVSDFHQVAIDPNQKSGFANAGLQLIDEAGLRDRLTLYEEPSELVLPRLLSQRRSFDLAFVDGNHRFEWVFVDLAYLARLLRPGSVVFVDDHQLPAIRKAVAFWVNDASWTVEEAGVADEHHHWIVVRTPAPPRERRFDEFVNF